MKYINSIKLNKSSLTLKVGETYEDMVATVSPSDATNKTLFWCSDNSAIASVNENSGRVFANSIGTTTIYACSTDGSRECDCCTVTVSNTVPVVEVTLNESNLVMQLGKSRKLTATVSPVNATNKAIKWISSNESVLRVVDGTVCALAVGTATITARATDGSEVETYCNIRVTENIIVESVYISEDDVVLTPNGSTYLHECVLPSNATNPKVVWSSSDTSVATVNPESGLVMAQGEGTAKIYATAADGGRAQTYIYVTVEPVIPVESVTINPLELKLAVGESKYIAKTVNPENATDKRVTWCSSNPDVACVDCYSGYVTANKVGTAVITVTTVDGGYSDSCSLTVTYCGGTNYRDVTQHTMVLQDDGYYVCSKCGYRVKSPALQDKYILNKSDLLAVLSLYHEYITVITTYPIYGERLLAMIDSIRSLPENIHKYEYCDANGEYVPEYGADYDSFRMYININKGVCLSEWVLLNTMFSIVGAVVPKPYNLMVSTISPLLLQQHPGATELSGSDILREYTLYLSEEMKIISKEVASAISILFAYDDIVNGTSCTSECYNVNITMLSKEAPFDCYQIDYHFSDGPETMARCSEYKVDGLQSVAPSVDYRDNVNNRIYSILA